MILAGGKAAGLAAATTPWLFVVAGDMPYVDRAFIDLVLSRVDAESDAVGIRIGRLPEPSCTAMRVAVWRDAFSCSLVSTFGVFMATLILYRCR